MHCKSVAYCSPECQHTGWAVHKTLCKKMRGFEVRNPRPVGGRLAVLFPEDEKMPRLVWVVCEEKAEASWEDDVDDYVFHIPHVETFLHGTPHSRILADNTYRYIDVDNHTVVVYCLDDFSISRINQCVLEITRCTAPHRWAGPIVVMNQIIEYDDSFAPFQDVTLGDLRVAVDYFKSYGSARPSRDEDDLARYMENLALERRPRKGVKILCEGHRALYGGQEFVQVNVPRDHPVYEESATSCSRIMGLPLLMRQYPADKTWANTTTSSSSLWLNSAATFMALNADPDGSSYGQADANWTKKVGSVLVVREDGKDLTPKQVWALSEYCKLALVPKNDSLLAPEVADRLSRALVLSLLTRDSFERYLEGFKKKMGTADNDCTWASVVSPYSV